MGLFLALVKTKPSQGLSYPCVHDNVECMQVVCDLLHGAMAPMQIVLTRAACCSGELCMPCDLQARVVAGYELHA